ncbi:MAG TPA: DUF4012 domain-containing protein [Mycobacteriales bacterium]|nr:DUF4012 domain-containing protein [Mycobacteriales bacterium]HVW81489.1 DUF4012 domain-containing protein [Mycobacteriales bacterium]
MAPESQPPAPTTRGRRPNRRPLIAGLLLVAAALLVGAIWIVVSGWRAHGDLERMRADVVRLRADLVAGRVADVHHDLAAIQAEAAAAHNRTTGPAWWVGAHIPGLGSPLRTIRGIALTGRSLSRTALPEVVAGGVALDPQQLRVASNRIDLARLEQAGPSLARAVPAVDAARSRVAGLPASWLGPVANGRSSLLTQLSSLEGTLRDTVIATRVMPAMLGDAGPRNYLVVFEGDNEARAIGGILGGYGVVHADHGRLQLSQFGNDSDLGDVTARVDLGQEFEKAYGGTDAYQSVADADISPHFPDAARIWSSMAAQRLGISLDGVIAMDPVALARVLSVIGPVEMPDGTRLTGTNLVRLLDVGVYRRFDSGTAADTPARRAFFVAAAQAVTQAALHRSIDTAALLHALASSAGQRRLLVYASSPQEEAPLATTPLAGILPETTRPFSELVVTNDSATKLDYYVHRSLTYQRSSCAATTATVTLRLRDAAPRSGLPAYMTQGVQWGDEPHPPGSEYLIVSLYSTQGSSVSRVTLDGGPLGTYTARDRGHPVTETSVTIKPGHTVEMVFTVKEPAATGPVILPVQPLAQPMTLRDEAPAC